LNQEGGLLVLFRSAGMLAGERQSAGTLALIPDAVGPHAGLGRRGGRIVEIPLRAGEQEARAMLSAALAGLQPWLPDELQAMIPC
jgi:hypothetical protein